MDPEIPDYQNYLVLLSDLVDQLDQKHLQDLEALVHMYYPAILVDLHCLPDLMDLVDLLCRRVPVGLADQVVRLALGGLVVLYFRPYPVALRFL